MKPVKQTKFGWEGNCFAASLASIKQYTYLSSGCLQEIKDFIDKLNLTKEGGSQCFQSNK